MAVHENLARLTGCLVFGVVGQLHLGLDEFCCHTFLILAQQHGHPVMTIQALLACRIAHLFGKLFDALTNSDGQLVLLEQKSGGTLALLQQQLGRLLISPGEGDLGLLS